MNSGQQRSIISKTLCIKLQAIRQRRRGPRIDPWRTPAFTYLQDECRSFKTTFSFLDFKKYFKISSNYQEYHFLSTMSSCHTLSNALETSKNTLRISKTLSQDLHISGVIKKSWLMQKLPPLKPDWCDEINVLSMGRPHYISNDQLIYHKLEVMK